MSEQATKPKEAEKAPEVKTYENAQSVALDSNEKEKLSRSMLVKWFEAKKYEKLKGLQDQLVRLSGAEREVFKKKIIENTKKDLEKHKELTEVQIQKRAEDFAEALFKTLSGVGNVKTVAETYEKVESDEDAFFNLLSGFVDADKDKSFMQRLVKDEKFQAAIGLFASKSPEVAKKLEFYMQKGDYDSFKKEIVKSSKGLPVSISERHIDQIAAMTVYDEASYQKITGIKKVDKMLSWLDSVRYVGHGLVISRAAEDLKIPTMLVMRLGKFTLNELKTQDDILQRHRYLVSDKENKTEADQNRLVFIDGIHVIIQRIEQKQQEKNLEGLFRNALDKYLGSKPELSEEDKMHLKQSAKFEDLRALDIFTLIYVEDENREKIFAYSMSRVQKMYKNFNSIFGEDRIVRRTMRKYHARRVVQWASDLWTKKAKGWKLNEIVGGLDDLQRRANSSTSRVDDLYKRIEDFKSYEKNRGTVLDPKKLLHEELLEHDMIHKQYEELVKKTTAIMSKQGQELVEVGKHLEVIRKGAGEGFLTKDLSQLPHVSDDTLKKLFPDAGNIADLRKTLKGGDLIRAYMDGVVNLKTMQDVTRTRFAHLANSIDEAVAKPFGAQWSDIMDKAGRTKETKMIRQDIDAVKDAVTAKGKASWALKNLSLPIIVVGAQGYNLFNGTSKSREALWDLGEAAAGFTPFLGTALDVRGAVMGESLSGKKLSWKERAMYGVFATVGVIADVGTILGGWGLGLRAGLGGMRTSRRAVQIGKEAKTAIQQTEGATKLFGVQSWIASASQKFNKFARAERATELGVTAKAMEQAKLMDRVKEVPGFDKAKLTDPSDIDNLMKMARTPDQINDLRKLKTLMHETGVGVDYLQIARNAGQTIDLPAGFFGKMFFSTKEAFITMKSKLLSIGIAKDTIQSYERTFDVVQAAKKTKAEAENALELYKLEKQAELVEQTKAFETLRGQSLQFGADGKKYADVVEEHRKLASLQVDKQSQYNALKNKHDKLVKDKASRGQVDDAYNAMKKAETAAAESKTSVAKINVEKNKLKTSLDQSGADVKKWREGLDQADVNLARTENGILKKQDVLREANESLHYANQSRSLLELEMTTKAADFARANERVSTVARYLQYGGLAMGAVYVFSGFNYGPAEQLRAAGKLAGGGYDVGKKAGKMFFESNAGAPPLDELLEKRIKSIEFKKFLNAQLEKSAKEGQDPAAFLAEHSESDEAKEIAQKMGLTEKMQKLISEGKVKVKKMAQAVAGGGAEAADKVQGVVSEKVGDLKS